MTRPASDRMTKGERDDLVRLVKQRERLAKTSAEQRSAVLLAEFEQQISAQHSFDKDEVWKSVYVDAAEAFKDCNQRIAARCRELGIPEPFAPQLYMAWASRGESATKERRDELRRLAKAEIAALEQAARVAVESESVKAQTEIIANGLTSEAAIAFLDRLPAVETMMPTLSIGALEQRLAKKQASQITRRAYDA